jgi:hypothetical protein
MLCGCNDVGARAHPWARGRRSSREPRRQLEGIGNAAYTKSSGRREWEGDATFDPGSGVLEVTCAQDGGPIQIGPAPEFGALVGGLAAGILIPLLFGVVGFVMLIVVAVLYATGRPRDVPAPQ